jgi:hypothetical protein
MKVSKKDIKKWCKALDSGKYKQAKGYLQTKDGYCCLGVACKLFNKNHPIKDGTLQGNMPSLYYQDPQWLIDINLDFSSKAGSALSMLNDYGNYTFPEIATLLELVYIHKILD